MQTTEQKKMLIESMKKLSQHISNNPNRQQEIFGSLTPNDIKKIVNNLNDENQYLRRVSALLLCELLYKNNEIKNKFNKMILINPSHGRICLNGIPPSLHKYPTLVKRCIELMKNQAFVEEEEKMCWFINFQRKNIRLQYMDYKKYSSFTFLDPSKTIFGFTCNTEADTGKLRKRRSSSKSSDKQSSSSKIFNKSYAEYLDKKKSKAEEQLSQQKKQTKPRQSYKHYKDYLKESKEKYQVKIRDTIQVNSARQTDRKKRSFGDVDKSYNETIPVERKYVKSGYGGNVANKSYKINTERSSINQDFLMKDKFKIDQHQPKKSVGDKKFQYSYREKYNY